MSKKKITDFIPRKTKQGLINLNIRLSAFLILNSRIFRDIFIKRTIKKFQPNKKCLVNVENPFWTIGSFWDSDGRFQWLECICERKNVNIIHLPRDLYRNVFTHLFYFQGYEANADKGEIPLNVFYDKKFIRQRAKYLFYCNEVAKSIANQYKVDIFLIFKLNDDWIIDVLRGIRSSKFPLVVHDREHGITPKRMKIYPPFIKDIVNDLKVDKICTSNKTHYDFFLKCGFDRDNLALTGKPDSDAWFIDKKITKKAVNHKFNNQVPLITFFSFGQFNYLNFFYKSEKRNWLNLADDFHNVLIEVLRKLKGRVQIAYKLGGKSIRDYYPGFDKFFKKVIDLNYQDSIVFLDGNTPTIDLLKVSDCILGFHTLGIIEGMFTDKPICYGAWGDLFDDIKDTLIPFHKMKGIDVCDNPDQLRDCLIKNILNPVKVTYQREERDKNIEEFLYKADGQSSERLFNVINQVYRNFYKEN